MVNDKAAATGYKPKNNAEKVALKYTRGDVILSLRILLSALAAVILFVLGHHDYAWFLVGLSAFVETTQALRYISVVVRETASPIYVTNNSTHTHPGL